MYLQSNWRLLQTVRLQHRNSLEKTYFKSTIFFSCEFSKICWGILRKNLKNTKCYQNLTGNVIYRFPEKIFNHKKYLGLAMLGS